MCIERVRKCDRNISEIVTRDVFVRNTKTLFLLHCPRCSELLIMRVLFNMVRKLKLRIHNLWQIRLDLVLGERESINDIPVMRQIVIYSFSANTRAHAYCRALRADSLPDYKQLRRLKTISLILSFHANHAKTNLSFLI